MTFSVHLCTLLVFSRENQLEHGAHERLNKKQLRKIGERKIVTHQTEPLHERSMNPKTVVVGIVEEENTAVDS